MEHRYRYAYKNVEARPLDSSDIEYLRLWRNDEGNTRYLSKIGHISAPQQEQWYLKYLGNENEICFAIDEVETIGHIVGSASLYEFQGSQGEFGKILIGDAAAHGKKVGFNAIVAILKIAFLDLGLDKVILHCFKENRGAMHVYHSVGFNVAGEHVTEDGVEYVMEIEKEDYLKLYGDDLI